MDEETGLTAESYAEAEVEEKIDAIFTHVFRQYPDAVHHAYAN